MEIPLRVHDLGGGRCPLLGPACYVWMQGCPRRCEGCCNRDALDPEGAALELTAAQLADACRQIGGPAVILTGGEPFSQAAGLARTCGLLKALWPTGRVLAYTGYRMEQLVTGAGPGWSELLGEVDAVIDGPFLLRRLSDDPLLGSDNQRIFVLTDRITAADVMRPRPASVQLVVGTGGRARVIGTGRRGVDMNRLVEEIQDQGLRMG